MSLKTAKQNTQTAQMLVYALVAVFAVGIIGGTMVTGGVHSLARQFDHEQRELYIAQQEALAPWKAATGVAVQVAGILLVLGTSAGIIYAGWIGLSYLDRKARLVYPRDGLFPLVEARKDVTIYDPNRSIAGAVRVTAAGYVLPQMQPSQLMATVGALETQRAAALASGGGNITTKIDGAVVPNEVLTAAGTVAELPTRVPLRSLLAGQDISLERLVLGVAVGHAGQLETITGDMSNLVHVAVGGSSGWGKSVFLRSLAYQLTLARERPDLVLVDLEGVTLAPFSKSGRLLYPLADNEQDAVAVLSALSGDELNRRKALFAKYPGVDSLSGYNAVAEEKLEPIVAIVDEATALLSDKRVEKSLRTVALRARKYGLWLLLAGQDWKASSLDTAIRNQLSTRVQFKALSGAQSRVLLGQAGAEALDVKGRALAVIPGRGLMTLQTPFIGTNALDFEGGSARRQIPSVARRQQVRDDATLPDSERVRMLHRQGVSLREIQKRVYGYTGGTAYEKAKEALGSSSTTR